VLERGTETQQLTSKCVSMQNGRPVGPFTISELKPGSPAEQTGLFRVGDIVHAVDGKPIEHLSLKHVARLTPDLSQPFAGSLFASLALSFLRFSTFQCH
jgi:hypothetical protein